MSQPQEELKFIAFYLPQFHAIPENDGWWGRGFTEWTNTKKAAPLFGGHVQPRAPLRHYYYDLLDIRAHQWQSELLNRYGVYGLCCYHYWFDGRLLLEKPMELLLRHPEIGTRFCFSWANEPWTRNWDGGSRAVLMPQRYGTEEDWNRHFDYLLPFFRDERYIRVDGKPLFVLYASGAIGHGDEMIACWRRRAEREGLNGIYLVETLNSKPGQNRPRLKDSDACIEFEPTLTLFGGYTPRQQHRFILDTLHVFSYDAVWRRMLARSSAYGERKKFPGAFVDWDNSPRVGKRASVCVGASPRRFGEYLGRLAEKCREEGSGPFIFINAWNEWAEGAYLEPDEKNGYGYLEAIKEAGERFGTGTAPL